MLACNRYWNVCHGAICCIYHHAGQKHCLSKIYKIRVILNWTVEMKVLVVLCYYVILGVAVLTIFTRGLFDINEEVIKNYFICESKGLLPNLSCQRSKLEAALDPTPTSIAIVIIGFLPAVNLVYVVKFSELKRKLKTYSQTGQVQHIQKEANGAPHYIPYVANYERKSTLHHSPRTVHTNTVNTEPLITSQMNSDLCY